MEYPTLEKIFWEFNLNAVKTPDIDEMDKCLTGYLDKLVDKQKLSDSEVDRIAELVCAKPPLSEKAFALR